jgi:hypothetical protein
MKIYPKRWTVRKLCKIAGISQETLYREVRRLLMGADLKELKEWRREVGERETAAGGR